MKMAAVGVSLPFPKAGLWEGKRDPQVSKWSLSLKLWRLLALMQGRPKAKERWAAEDELLT